MRHRGIVEAAGAQLEQRAGARQQIEEHLAGQRDPVDAEQLVLAPVRTMLAKKIASTP